tara:strand:- start:708 stop:1457 length:750 start_codon:yes stop_codon:yes gene_type:complete
MNKLSAVFWDVDGTIADTELCGHRVAFNRAFMDFDLDWYWNKNKYLELLRISGGLNRIIQYRNEVKSELSDNDCTKIQSRKRFHYKELIKSGKISVREGVLRLIDELAKLKVKQLIVTTSGRESLDPFLYTSLKSHYKFFSKIITYEDVSNHKPSPDAYKLAIVSSKIPPINCIAIEDSFIGAKAAKSANVSCLLTLPPWSKTFQNIPKIASACVNSLGSKDSPTKLIYGQRLVSNYVDSSYLSNLLIN